MARVFIDSESKTRFEEGLYSGSPIVEEDPGERLVVRCLSIVAEPRGDSIEALLGFSGRPAPFTVRLEITGLPLDWQAFGMACADDMRARGLVTRALDKADERTSARRYDVHQVTPQHVLVQDVLRDWEKRWSRVAAPLPAQQREDLCNCMAELLRSAGPVAEESAEEACGGAEEYGDEPVQEKQPKGRRVLASQDAHSLRSS